MTKLAVNFALTCIYMRHESEPRGYLRLVIPQAPDTAGPRYQIVWLADIEDTGFVYCADQRAAELEALFAQYMEEVDATQRALNSPFSMPASPSLH